MFLDCKKIYALLEKSIKVKASLLEYWNLYFKVYPRITLTLGVLLLIFVFISNSFNYVAFDIFIPLLNFTIENFFFCCLIIFFALILLELKEKRKQKLRFPIINVSNTDNITVLLALFKIRCLEISRMYAIIRNYQIQAKKKNWIGVYLNEYFDTYENIWDYNNEKQEEIRRINLERVASLLEGKFSTIEYEYNGDIKNSNILDLQIALLLYHEVYDIKKIQGLRTLGVLDNSISSLMSEYRKFNLGSFDAFLHDDVVVSFAKLTTIRSHQVIGEIWEELLFALKSSLIFLKLKNDNTFDVDQIIKEIDALRDLQHIAAVRKLICQKNSKEKNLLFNPLKEKEDLIVAKIDSNPINDIY